MNKITNEWAFFSELDKIKVMIFLADDSSAKGSEKAVLCVGSQITV